MNRRWVVLLPLVLGVAAAALPQSSVPPAHAAAGAPPRRMFINGVLDTGQFLPDTAQIGRVNGEIITAADFVNSYFNAYAPDRPSGDSLGRVEWLNSMVNKAVLGSVARQVNKPLGFEDRATLRDYRQRVLSNVLFQRAVMDSSVVDTAEARAVFEREFKTEYHVRHVLLNQLSEAVAVRQELRAGRVSWNDAVRSFSIAKPASADGDLGWVQRLTMNYDEAQAVQGLKPGEISDPVEDSDGYHLVLLVERKPTAPPLFESVRRAIAQQLQGREIRIRADRLLVAMRAQLHVRYDSTAINWASGHFKPSVGTERGARGMGLVVDLGLPEFAPSDTGRVLATYDGGVLSLGRLLAEYGAIPGVQRPPINSFDQFRIEVDNIILEPLKAHIAELRGLDKDPLAVSQIEKKYEQILVEHLYQDSVESRIRVTPAERRKYYDSHANGFTTFPLARFAQLIASDSAAAVALAARLKNGENAEEIIRADSIAGRGKTGMIREDRQYEETEYHPILFNELKPGQVRIVGPDRDRKFAVLQLLSFDPGHLLPWKEAEGIADDSLRAQKSEVMFKALLARHRRQFKIHLRPELVMRIKLVDPASRS
jgi:hypothetical protein